MATKILEFVGVSRYVSFYFEPAPRSGCVSCRLVHCAGTVMKLAFYQACTSAVFEITGDDDMTEAESALRDASRLWFIIKRDLLMILMVDSFGRCSKLSAEICS